MGVSITSLIVLESPRIALTPQIGQESADHSHLGNDIYWKERTHGRNVQSWQGWLSGKI
jgi:hypothetical protein